MKPLHKLISLKHDNQALHYIQVSGGFAFATDGYNLCKTPVTEVFGEDVVTDEEEFYIHADEWRTAKLDKAVTIKRDGLLFESLDRKGKTLGRAKAIPELPDNLKFPSCDVVIPTEDTVFQMAVSANRLKALSDVFGTDAIKLEITALGRERAIRIKPITDYAGGDGSNAIGVSMPIRYCLPEYLGATDSPEPADKDLEAELDEPADELRDAKKRISELESENIDLENKVSELEKELDEAKEELDELELQTMGTGNATTENGHAFRYYTENPIDAQIVEAFAECMAEIPPADMLENLRLMKEYKILM